MLAAVAIGAALAVAGAAYQCCFATHWSRPTFSAFGGRGAGRGARDFLFAAGRDHQVLAFGVGLAAVAMVYVIANAVRGHDPMLVLVLAGVVIGALGGALNTLVKYLADPYNELPAITFWLLAACIDGQPETCFCGANDRAGVDAAGAAALARQRTCARRRGSALAGCRMTVVRVTVIACATLMTAAACRSAASSAGSACSSRTRAYVDGPEFSRLLPMAMLLGAGFLLGVDTLARTAARIEIPLGVLTAFVGTPLFIWQLVVARRIWK